MATTERLINFPPKPVPAGSDIVYVGDMSDSGNEVQSTIAEIGAAMSGVVLLVANNLSDLASASAARTNLGLGSAATHAATDFLLVANNLSDLSSASTARTNLGLGTAAVQNVAFFLQTANNLSDLASAATARTNLGLGTAAVKSASGSGSVLASVTGSFTIGHYATFADTNGTIQDGGSVSGFLLAANNLSDVASASTSRTNLGLGNAAVANQTSVTNLVASISGAITINHYAQFADNFGTLKDGGTAPAGVLLSANNLSDVSSVTTSRTNLGLGTAAVKTASDGAETFVASVTGAITTGHYAIFADTNGSIEDGGATPAGVLLAVNNLSDVANAATSRTNLGLGTAATQNSTFFAQVANNLSDLASAATARTNLGLGTAATKAASDNTKTTLASVTGSFTTGHLATFADTSGTIQDGGAVPTSKNFSVNFQLFPSTATYTPTAGTVDAIFEGVGGGAAGGGATASVASISAGGGGGGGGYFKKRATIAQIGATAAIVIGAGGTAGTAGNNPGNNGGNTTVTLSGTGSIVLTGNGGVGGVGNAAASTISTGGGIGGTATNGDLNITGQTGSNAFGIAVAGGAFIVSGSGGSSQLGLGAPTNSSVGTQAANGVSGSDYGSGGSGGLNFASNSASQTGGAGQPGFVLVTEFIYS